MTAALSFVVFVLALSLAGSARPAKAADINQLCNDCLLRTQQQYERCQAQFGFDTRCDEQFNRDIVNCYRQFCEQ
ncbi:MAG TPA: hypothetical protein VJ866_02305 [Pyrinomonadaceae bacterium]|nr:hypothetical protein [Pyrinomonadaceae bacterium]